MLGVVNLIDGSYLLGCSLLFFVIANYSNDKYEWLTIALLSLALLCNKEYFNNTEDALYYTRSLLSFCAAKVLISKHTRLSLYQAFIQMIILFSYAALAYDVANNKHIIIYNNFEAVIHALVVCQFIGVIPELRNSICNIFSISFSRHKHNKGV